MTAIHPTAGQPLCDPFVEYYDDVLRFLRARVGYHAAADVAQDVYVRLRQRIGDEAIDHPRAYVFRTARSALIDHHRHGSHRQHASLDDEGAGAVCSPEREPQTVLEQRERLAHVRAAIQGLPPKCRAVFIMHRTTGLSQQEIAARFGISVSTVEKHILRALASCSDGLARVDRDRPA
jgi:RNA polymerase sigma-70 factor (ECF subfamily)